MDLTSTVVMLLIVMDPFGNVAVINSLLSEIPLKKRQKILFRESLFCLVIMLASAMFGDKILLFLGLEQPTLKIAGGLILFLISLGMVFPHKKLMAEDQLSDPFIVPIAIPLMTGPSSISIVFLLSHKHGNAVFSVVGLAWFIATLILYFSPYIFKWLGKRGAGAIERLMGMLLIMISVHMLLSGVKEYFA
ncbi:MAG: MarC family protein [Lentisphaerales bacterium]|nr:MarC family protein [Lentisphaerales bacterium]